MSDATLNGHTVTHARVELPQWGLWWAEAKLDLEVVLTGAVTLQLADLTLRGTVVAGGTDNGTSSYRIVAGAGGWGRAVAAKDYANDAGVKLATIIREAAQDAGETFDATTASGTAGPKFVREADSAARALQLLAPQAWYVGQDGITRLGKRAGAALTFTKSEFDPDNAHCEVAEDSIAALLPGATLDGREVVDVHHVLDARKLRSTLWFVGRTPGSRRLAAQQKLFRQLFPDYRYRGIYEYRVVTQQNDRLNLQPVRASLGMPDLRRVRVRGGLPGFKATVMSGALVLVAFVNADPSRPAVVGFDDPESPGWMPLQLELGGPLALGVARQTDAVQAGPFSGVIVGGSARIKASL